MLGLALLVSCSANPEDLEGAAAKSAVPKDFVPVADVASVTVLGPRSYGFPRYDQSGPSVVPVGDLNGDGVGDLALADPFADPEGKDSGAVSVILDWEGRETIDVREVPELGFAVRGSAARQELGAEVVPTGDMNGDGFDDVAIGTDPYKGAYAVPGDAYVILGGLHPRDVDVRHLGRRGFRIVSGRSAEDPEVYDAVDWNVDGYSDILVSGWRGRTYVVFGGPEARDISLPHGPTSAGREVVVLGPEREDFGWPMASAGDVNGDGLPDIAIGAREASHQGRRWSGSTYVVFGTGDPGLIDVSRGGGWGFRVDGPVATPPQSQCVFWDLDFAGVGDVNGDGLEDLAVTEPYAPSPRSNCPNAVYVVFGRRDHRPVDLLHPARSGFRIVGRGREGADRPVGHLLPDLNGDGLDEVAVGSVNSPGPGFGPGTTYLVLGKTDPAEVRLPHLGGRGFRIEGGAVVGLAELDGDGVMDMVLRDSTDVVRRGQIRGPIAYVVPGSTLSALAAERR